MSTAARLAQEAKAVFEAADRKNRALSADERIHVEELISRAKEHREAEKSLRELDPGMGNVFTDPNANWGGGLGPGDRFISSAEYKAIRDPGNRGQTLVDRPGSGQ